MPSLIPTDWWSHAFPLDPYPSKPPGNPRMLSIVAYDIAEPKRLAKVAKICEDFGTRVQFSVFELRLQPKDFDQFWARLTRAIDPETDRIVAYHLDARCAKLIQSAGTMVNSENVVCYLF